MFPLSFDMLPIAVGSMSKERKIIWNLMNMFLLPLEDARQAESII